MVTLPELPGKKYPAASWAEPPLADLAIYLISICAKITTHTGNIYDLCSNFGVQILEKKYLFPNQTG